MISNYDIIYALSWIRNTTMSALNGSLNHNYKHGGRRLHPKEYKAWSHMKGRCYCKTNPKYASYGNRGISVCAEWKDNFQQFYLDMGDRPDNCTSIDRIDNNGDYTPKNCAWSNGVKQANNRRSSRLLEHNGQTKTVAQWSMVYGVKSGTIRNRIDIQGMSIKDALETPAIMAPQNQLIKFRGKEKTMEEWGLELGVAKSMLYQRLRRGFSVEDAFTKPPFWRPA